MRSYAGMAAVTEFDRTPGAGRDPSFHVSQLSLYIVVTALMPLPSEHTAAIRIQRLWRRCHPLVVLRPVEIRGGRRRRGRRVSRARSPTPTRAPLALPVDDAPPGRYHAWYSYKEKYAGRHFNPPDWVYYERYLGGGETVEVTAVTTCPDHGVRWDDSEYRGLVIRNSGVCRPSGSGLLHRLGMY